MKEGGLYDKGKTKQKNKKPQVHGWLDTCFIKVQFQLSKHLCSWIIQVLFCEAKITVIIDDCISASVDGKPEWASNSQDSEEKSLTPGTGATRFGALYFCVSYFCQLDKT